MRLGEVNAAFVMADGGSLGAVEVGMLLALVAWAETPAFIVGASAGAIDGAFFTAEPSAAGVPKLDRIWRGMRRRGVFPLTLGSVFGWFAHGGHLVDSGGIRQLIERHLPYQRLEGAALPIHIVASDIINGDEVLLYPGLAIDAILASAAIPGVFAPVCIDGGMLADGGVANNTPISTAVRLGATRAIVLPTGFACASIACLRVLWHARCTHSGCWWRDNWRTTPNALPPRSTCASRSACAARLFALRLFDLRHAARSCGVEHAPMARVGWIGTRVRSATMARTPSLRVASPVRAVSQQPCQHLDEDEFSNLIR